MSEKSPAAQGRISQTNPKALTKAIFTVAIGGICTPETRIRPLLRHPLTVRKAGDEAVMFPPAPANRIAEAFPGMLLPSHYLQRILAPDPHVTPSLQARKMYLFVLVPQPQVGLAGTDPTVAEEGILFPLGTQVNGSTAREPE